MASLALHLLIPVVISAFQVPTVSRRRGCFAFEKIDDDLADEELAVLLKERVSTLGGERSVQMQAQANKAKRSILNAGQSLQDFGRNAAGSATKLLGIDNRRELSEAERTRRGGWVLTLGFLGLVVLLAFIQSFRIDPSNYPPL